MRVRESDRRRYRASAPPSAASVRPTRTRSGAAPSASWISPTCRRSAPRSSGCWRITTRCAAASGLPRSMRHRRCMTELAAIAPEGPALHGFGRGRCSTQKRREGKRILFEGAQGALLDIDHGTYPLRDLLQHGGGAGCDRLGPRPERDRLRARHLQGLHDPGRRGAVPDRADATRSARRSASAAANSAPSPAGRAAAAGSTPCWCARPSHLRHQRPCADQARHPRRVRGDQGLRGLSTGRPRNRLSAGRRACAGPGRAGLRDDRRLAGADRRCALLGASCRRRRSNTCAASRNWLAARWPCCPPAPSARTRS